MIWLEQKGHQMSKKSRAMELVQNQATTFSTRQTRLMELSATWNDRLNNPLAFVPNEVIKKGGVDPEKAIAENMALGHYAANFLRQELKKIAVSRGVEETAPIENDKIVAVGYGLGYDSNYSNQSGWLKDATLAKLRVWWIDVSELAIKKAEEVLNHESSTLLMDQGILVPYPEVRQADIEEVLEEVSDETLDLDLGSVKVWYLSRLIGCLTPRSSAENTLMLLGRSLGDEFDSRKTNRIIIVNALLDYNMEVESHRSTLYSENEIISYLEEGANRSVKIFSQSSYKYWNKIITCMSIGAE